MNNNINKNGLTTCSYRYTVSSGIFYIVFGFLASILFALVPIYFLSKQINKTEMALNEARMNADNITDQILELNDQYSEVRPQLDRIFENPEIFRANVCLFLNFIDQLPRSIGGRNLLDIDLSQCNM